MFSFFFFFLTNNGKKGTTVLTIKALFKYMSINLNRNTLPTLTTFVPSEADTK